MLKAGLKAPRLAPTIPRSTSPWVSTLGGPFYPFLPTSSCVSLCYATHFLTRHSSVLNIGKWSALRLGMKDALSLDSIIMSKFNA